MAVKTENLNLNTWLESDYVNFEEINENFETIDTFIVATEAGTVTSTYTDGSGISGNITWRYKKYSNKTIEIVAAVDVHNWLANTQFGETGIYGTTDMTINMPFSFVNLYDTHVNVQCPNAMLIFNKTAITEATALTIQAAGFTSETDTDTKRIILNIRGVEANG